jgi:branched-chain amino acid transport system substrate-binding protein
VQAAPIRVGLLFDFPQPDQGSSFEHAVRLGIAEVADTGRLDRDFEFAKELARGLPAGTAHEVEQSFVSLVEAGALCVIGPSISDNGLFVRELADAFELPCINYTGGEQTRGEWMFHYQVGSLEEEPAVLASHLAGSGHRRVAVIHDRSPVGRSYLDWFEMASVGEGLELAGVAQISPLSEDAGAQVDQLRSSEPDALVYLGLGVAARTVALALLERDWRVPVAANSALMFGYAQRDWRQAWEGWVYVDTVSDNNPRRATLRERSPAAAAGPIGVAAFDMGRLLAEGVARAGHLTRAGLREGLERVKRLPASSGAEGTTMGFGRQDHGALKGPFLVLRQWLGGRTVEYQG